MKRYRYLWLTVALIVVVAAVGLRLFRRKAPAAEPALDPVSYVDSGDRNFKAGRITAAVIDYNHAIALAPADSRPYIGLAVLYEAVERPDLAVVAMEQLRAKNPNAPHLWCRLAEAYLGTNDPKTARVYGKKAVEVEPNCARAFSVYGIAEVRHRYWDSAAAALKRARSLAPEDGQIGEVLVDTYLQQGTYEQAVRLAEELLAKSPQSSRLYYKLGWAYSRMPQNAATTARALQSLQHSAELDPKWFEPRAEMGRLLKSLGRTEEAQAAFEQAWQIAPDVPGVAFNLAALYRQKGDPRAARMDALFKRMMRGTSRLTGLRQLYNQNPDDAKTALELARMEGQSGAYATALNRVRKLLQADPGNLEALKLYVGIDTAARTRAPDYLSPGPGIGLPGL